MDTHGRSTQMGVVTPSPVSNASEFRYEQCVAVDGLRSGSGQVPYATSFDAIKRQVFTQAGYEVVSKPEPTPAEPVTSSTDLVENAPKAGVEGQGSQCKSEFLDPEGLGFVMQSEPVAVFLTQITSEFSQLRGLLRKFGSAGVGANVGQPVVSELSSTLAPALPMQMIRSSSQTIIETLRNPEYAGGYELAFTLGAIEARQRFGSGGPILFNAVNTGVE